MAGGPARAPLIHLHLRPPWLQKGRGTREPDEGKEGARAEVGTAAGTSALSTVLVGGDGRWFRHRGLSRSRRPDETVSIHSTAFVSLFSGVVRRLRFGGRRVEWCFVFEGGRWRGRRERIVLELPLLENEMLCKCPLVGPQATSYR